MDCKHRKNGRVGRVGCMRASAGSPLVGSPLGASGRCSKVLKGRSSCWEEFERSSTCHPRHRETHSGG